MMTRLSGLAIATVGLVLACASGVQAAEYEKYAIESASAALSNAHAGAHADFTTTIDLSEREGVAYAKTKDVVVELPPGLVGDPQAFPKCTTSQLGTEPRTSKCPQDAQVGVIDITVSGFGPGTFYDQPIYNMPTLGGDALARFGFFAGGFPMYLNVRLNSETNGLVASVEGAPSAEELVQAKTTFWGVPGASVHDAERLTPAESYEHTVPPGGRKSNLPEVPFMTNPTSCGEERHITVTVTSYQLSDSPRTMSAPFPHLEGCGAIEFNPTVALAPTATEGMTGTGLSYRLDFPTKGLEFGSLFASSVMERDEVVLPEGMTINPSSGEGMGVCTEADLARETYDSPPGAGCPESSKIGSVAATTPLIDRNPTGALYVAKPYENPFGSLLALYMVLKIPDRGVLVKLPGRVSLDPATGRITTIFEDIPQLPIASFSLQFREGARAPLVTPFACGAYRTVSNMTPWSALNSTARGESTFEITGGPNGTVCSTSNVPPFSPRFLGGTHNNRAGSYSQLELEITRIDGEQEITGFSTKLPPGLSGNLSGIPFCPEADIQRAREQTGAQAEAEPACPAASQIGHTIAEAGVGSVLAQTPGSLYLAGPFEGAPFSVVDVTAAKVGPFDLGTVVVHLPLNVDPLTAQVSIPSGPADQIPHILDGIVIHLRKIRVYIDRQHFMLNPTSCEPMSLSATVTGSGANFASAADDVPFTASNRFQAAECAHLTFNPTFEATTQGKTSRRLGASLKVKLTYPKGSIGKAANIHEVKVDLPKQLPSRLSTLQQACTDRVFESNPAACPVASRVGMAKAVTSILPVPLTGPAYFVSHGGAKFPELIIVLQGYGVTVDLHGETFISNAGITSSTFRAVPDQPVTSFELTLPQGPDSALGANGSLCVADLAMPTIFTAQDGKVVEQKTPIEVQGCSRALSVRSHEVRKGTLILRIYAPSAGIVKVSGKGLTAQASKPDARKVVTLRVHERKAGDLRARVSVVFTPSRGKARKRQAKMLSVKFKAPKGSVR